MTQSSYCSVKPRTSKSAKRRAGFEAEKRQAVPAKLFFHVRQRHENPLAGPVAAVHYVV